MDKYDDLRKRARESRRSVENNIQRLGSISAESKRVADVAGNAGSILSEIDQAFADKTRLGKTDISFLFLATALQCIRQYVFTNDSFRVKAEQGDRVVKDPIKKITPKHWHDILMGSVPYDAVQRAPDFREVSTGIGGSTHRFRTLGHDPVLGWFFGPVNILTDSLTKSDFVSTYSVAHMQISGFYPGGTAGAVQGAIEQAQANSYTLPAAVAKQAIHFGADYFTKQGLPVPLISSIHNDWAKDLIQKYNIDAYSITRGAVMSTLINTIISLIHKFLYDETKHGSAELYEVRTRKILSYSNLLATTSNVIYVAVTKNLKALDAGGLLVTLYRIISDYHFIQRIKREFLHHEFNRTVQGDEYDF
ncbi:hypothetical protein [Paenibacillus sp. NFR01]|uniref:hypothetical protein n=1 Tax=Paenibacillus sp. NFR01 TaxID=1566279 RepID=UPI0008B24BB4|nr:hypothetical protein [Paenibacillus sp. NFR01]SEU18478.1 hypothetical protein SAMN03159358_3793 [Paenibacillus sp. NFR01]